MGLLTGYSENQDPYGRSGEGGGPNDPPPPVDPGGTPSHEIHGSPVPPPPAAGKGGGGGPGVLDLGPDFPPLGIGTVPKFNAPGYVPLDAAKVLQDPGYNFRIQQGENALQRSAASKGLLRSGGTLKDLIQYDQNFASNEYNQAEDRNRAGYALNYQLAKDEYAPLLAEWNTLSADKLQKALAIYNRGTIWGAPYHGGGGGGYPEQLLGPGQFGL